MCNAKLLGNTDVQTAPNNTNKILKNATTAVPLEYLSNFLRPLETALINCKVELKLKSIKCCVLSIAGADMQMLILIILLLLSKTQNYMFL